MSFFSRNLVALKAVSPEAAAVVENAYTSEEVAPEKLEPDERLVVEASAEGSPTARLAGAYLHSRRDPGREARRVIAEGVSQRATTILILGFGLGYHVDAALSIRSEAKVVVVIPSVSVFASALAARDLRHILENPRLVLLVQPSPETVAYALRAHESGELAVVPLRGERTESRRDYWAAIDAAVASYKHRREINRNTLIRFGRLWVRNLARNLRAFADARPVRELAGALRGFPALVLGAGPSLDRILPRLPELAKRMVVIAVDTALAPCLYAGVEPDFLVVVDPQYWNTRHLDRLRLEKTILISESSTHSRVFRLFRRLPTYFCSSLFPLGEYLEETVGERGRLGAGGSVSTTAWDFARYLGSREIVTAGVDLGFPERQTHCRGSFFEERAHLLSSRLSPAETQIFAYLYDADPYLVQATDGSQVLTDKRMVVYRWWFENQAAMHAEVRTLTTSAGGVRIAGVELVAMEELYRQPTMRVEIDRRIERYRHLGHGAEVGQCEKLEASLAELDSALARLESAARRALSIVRRAEGSADVAETLRLLDDIDQEIYATQNRRVPSFLMQDVIAELTEGSGGDAVTNSRRLYQSLLDSVQYHRHYLSRPQNDAEPKER